MRPENARIEQAAGDRAWGTANTKIRKWNFIISAPDFERMGSP